MNVRKRIELNEKNILIKEACFSNKSRGRKIPEPEDNYRTPFMHDRDRIIHSKSFRRLKHKTQVYIKTTGDHYRTRLTHTLEVSQIARTISRGIGDNEDLVEAITLGHDIGHVAFAHNGEEVLNERLPEEFRHNEQSVRVLEKLEKDGKGLNISYEVLDGILHHSGLQEGTNKSETLEGQIAKFADKIAYVNHDIDDSIRAGILKTSDLPPEYIKILGHTHGSRINTLVTSLVDKTNDNLKKGILKVNLEKEVFDSLYGLRSFMFEKVYLGDYLKDERSKAKFILHSIFDYYENNIEKMPRLYQNISKNEGIQRGVADFIAGMTDDYAIVTFNRLYVPKIVVY